MPDLNEFLNSLWSGARPWAESLLILAAGATAGFIARIVIGIVSKHAFSDVFLVASLRRRLLGVLGWFLPLLGVYLALPAATHANEAGWPRPLLVTLLIAGMGLLLVRLVYVLEDALLHRVQLDVADNLRARKIHTQFRILRRVLALTIWLLAGAAILLQFDGFRQFGRGLLASAGIASLVIGFAAQRTLGNLIAGFQIAVTQPIRLDDVVVVENEWGRIEEITLTYVVVKIWDERRLVLPIIYFLEKPFTNWTRTTSEILGTVFLHVDYRVPLDALRERLKELVDGHPDWDGRVAEIVAFEARPTTLEIRALVSSRESGAGWRLRCHVREGLVTFLQQNYPDSLPRYRAEVAGLRAGEPQANSDGPAAGPNAPTGAEQTP